MKLDKLQDFIISKLDELKVENIETLDVSKKTSIADRLIIGTGRSEKHIESAMENLRISLKEIDLNPKKPEGKNTGWVILDLFGIIVNLFTEEWRGVYNLEQLWTSEIK